MKQDPTKNLEDIAIVVDTNVLYANRLFRGPSIELLERFLRITKSNLFVPEIVFQESVKTYREQLSAKLEKAKGAVDQVKRLMIDDDELALPDVDCDKAVAMYEQYLNNRLEELDATRPTFDKADLSNLADRAISARRPFLKEDRGFRDALIWETIRHEIVGEHEATVFVTEDTAFYDDDALHPDLKRDLIEVGISEDAVRLVKTIDELKKSYIKPVLHQAIAAVDAIRSGSYTAFSIEGFLKDHFDELFAAIGSEVDVLMGDAQSVDEALRDLEGDFFLDSLDFEESSVVGAYEIGVDSVFVESEVSCLAYVTAFLFKSDYYSMPKEAPFSIEDHDWNKHYMLVQVELRAAFTLNVSLDVRNGVAKSWEIEGLLVLQSDA